VFCLLPGIPFSYRYFIPDIRLVASSWIENNIPENSVLLSEGGNVVDIPLTTKPYQLTNFDFFTLEQNITNREKLIQKIVSADYILVPSRRVFANQKGENYPISQSYYQALFMGTAMAISALPVIVRIMMDLKLFKTRIGMLVVASAMVDDIVGWIIFSVVLSMIGKGGEMSVGSTLLLTVGFAAFMLTIGRGLLNRLLPWVNKKLAWPGGLLALSLSLCFAGAAFTEFIGIHAVFGAFIVGIALGDSEHMNERAKEIVHQFINNIFAPLFFVAIGLRVNFLVNFDFWLTLVIILIAFAGKIIGAGGGTRLGGFTWRESLAAGFGMNARGAMEIILGTVALENGLINEKIFVSLVIMAIVTSMTSGPLMKRMLRNPAE
jgi:Kef-type K+ transport system membrane component KefB